jgi:formylglycine-generating enzyme required for sulfatase activity
MSEDRFGLVGKFIADRYEVEALVEEGGFSTIYRARHVIWDRPVAIKAFRAPQSLSEAQREELQQGFIREGALLAELSERSVAICQSRDVGTLTLPSGAWVPYLVLEWLDGESLEAMLTRERGTATREAEDAEDAEGASRPRTLHETMRLLEPIALALGVAHDRGIAHRDVKPGNLFLLRDGGIKLLDFGIAKAGARRDRKQTGPELRSFTPDYGAPEQFSMAFGPTGTWTDVFAFALIVVELLSGREALTGSTPEALARSAMHVDVRPTPRTRGVSAAVVPDAVDAVLARALAIDPRERFATAGEMWAALRSAVDGSLIAPRRSDAALASTVPPPAPLLERETRGGGWRSRAIAFGAGALTATLALLAAVHTQGSIARLSPLVRLAPLASPASAPTSPPPHVDAVRPEPVLPAAAPEPPTCPSGMAQVPGSAFFMGADQGVDAEKPAHPVSVAPYCIDLTEVTTAAYRACSDRGECKRAWSSNEWDGIKEHERKVFDPLCNARDRDPDGGRAQHPINCVDWSMAQAFCATRGARLPTEAEWELAARGPDGRTYPWGDDPPSARHLNACGKECAAWGKKNHVDEVAMFPEDDGFATTAPVGSFPLGRSPFGLVDMAGNVWEWVADRYAPYPASSPREPSVDPAGPPEGEDRVLRGGAWNGGLAPSVRPTFRYKARPATKGFGIGFRCARSL